MRYYESLNRDIWRLSESITRSGDPATIRKLIAEYVAEHPIDDELFLRDSVEPLLAVISKRAGASTVILGLGEMLDYSFDRSEDLADRLFFRVLILIVILVAMLLIVAIVFMRLLRQRPVDAGVRTQR